MPACLTALATARITADENRAVLVGKWLNTRILRAAGNTLSAGRRDVEPLFKAISPRFEVETIGALQSGHCPARSAITIFIRSGWFCEISSIIAELSPGRCWFPRKAGAQALMRYLSNGAQSRAPMIWF